MNLIQKNNVELQRRATDCTFRLRRSHARAGPIMSVVTYVSLGLCGETDWNVPKRRSALKEALHWTSLVQVRRCSAQFRHIILFCVWRFHSVDSWLRNLEKVQSNPSQSIADRPEFGCARVAKIPFFGLGQKTEKIIPETFPRDHGLVQALAKTVIFDQRRTWAPRASWGHWRRSGALFGSLASVVAAAARPAAQAIVSF